MNLFDLSVKRNLVDESVILDKMKKAQQINVQPQAKGNGPPLLQIINKVQESVDTYLGDKRNDYELITSPERFLEYCNHIVNNGIYAIDTETTGLDPLLDDIVGMSLYTPNEKPVYIPINHVSYITKQKLENQVDVLTIKRGIEMLENSNCKAIFANAQFDIRVIMKHVGVRIRPYFDCILAAHLLNDNEPNGGYRLKTLYKKYVLHNQEDAFSFGELFEGVSFDLVPPNVGYLYAARDAEVTWELYQFQIPFLTPNHPLCIKQGLVDVCNVFWNIEMPLTDVVVDMENNGIELDINYQKSLSATYNQSLKEKEQECYKILEEYTPQINQYILANPNCKIDNPININSPTQLAVLLYDILKVSPVDRKSPRGTGEDILEKINLPICKAILDYRGFAKLISTYIDKLDGCVNPNDGRIHCGFNQYGARCITGDSIVLTSNGYAHMRDFDEGHEDGEFSDLNISVLNRNLLPEQTSHFVKYKNRDTIKLELSQGIVIEGTPNHPIMCGGITKSAYLSNHGAINRHRLVEERKFKPLCEVTKDDYIQIPIGYNYFSNEYQPITYAEKSFYDTRVKDISIPTIFDEDFAEFLGIYFADGSVSSSDGHFRVQISNDDPDVITRTSELIKRIFGVEAKTIKSNTTLRTYISGKKLSLLSNYFCRGAYNKIIPKEIYQSPKSVITAFIRGLTLDSTYDKNRHRLSMTLCTYDNARFVQNCLFNIGIVAPIAKYKKTNRISVSGGEYVKFLKEIGVIQSCKRDESDIPDRTTRFILDNSMWVYVTDITYGKNDVYDFCVPETHSFVANGIINHNTGRFSSSNPNLQNIPSHDKYIRKMFKATDGYLLMSSDFS